jgi:CDP-2,3-bis-(O-geranylgeranyl)-sn-glycerol synthase
MSDPILLIKLVALLLAANGTPILVARVLKERLAMPLDGGLKLRDGRPLFGTAKTIRGIAASIVCTSLMAVVLRLEWETGAIFAAASMAGDLTSSFLKRRLGFKVHAQVFGLDQIPEALFPLLALQSRLSLGVGDIVTIVAAFVIYELAFWYLFRRVWLRQTHR